MVSDTEKTHSSKKMKKFLIFLCILLVLALVVLIMYLMNHITSVEVEGNNFYTDEEIERLVIDGELEHNAWYLYWKYHYAQPPEIPFVDKVEVELVGRGRVKLHIYEKSIIGYVEYLGSYMYFDKDGLVVESSQEEMDSIPKIIGLSYDRITLNEKIPVKEEKVFASILTLTNELKKNEIMPDKIQFNDELEATLYFGQAKVLMGSDENQSEKVARLKALLPDLEGKSGVLHMEEVSEDNKNIIFQRDEQ